MAPKSPLDDPEKAAFAWARYKRIMRFMFALTLLVVGGAMVAIFWSEAEVSPHFFIAVALGIGMIFYGDFPDAVSIAGSALIVAAGLWLWRQRQIKPRREVPPVEGTPD